MSASGIGSVERGKGKSDFSFGGVDLVGKIFFLCGGAGGALCRSSLSAWEIERGKGKSDFSFDSVGKFFFLFGETAGALCSSWRGGRERDAVVPRGQLRSCCSCWKVIVMEPRNY
jgi:hypothetical protein